MRSGHREEKGHVRERVSTSCIIFCSVSDIEHTIKAFPEVEKLGKIKEAQLPNL